MRKIFIAGHNGMVGSSIFRKLKNEKDIEIITISKTDLDLSNQSDVNDFFSSKKPSEVVLAAAKVGGIFANKSYPADFIYQNLQIQNNIIHAAHLNNVQKLLFLGSSCIYPKYAKQPLEENSLLTGILEPTNEAYAVAKIAGIIMCKSYNQQFGRDYRAVMPTNLYGPGDNYHLENSHVIPSLIRRFHDAKVKGLEKVSVWGSGKPMREFLYIDDMASACIFVHELGQDIFQNGLSSTQSHINIGSGKDISISELANIIKTVTGYEGMITFDKSKPDGTPKKQMDVQIINKLGWKANISLKRGIELTYEHFKENLKSLRV